MLKRGIIGMVVGIALTGAVLAVTASGSTRSHSAGAVRLHLIEHPVNEHVVDLPPTGVDSQGDLFPFSNLLFDSVQQPPGRPRPGQLHPHQPEPRRVAVQLDEQARQR